MGTHRTIMAVLAMASLCMLAAPAAMGMSTPTCIYGYVKFDGSPVDGATVSIQGGPSTTTRNSGYYIFGDGVNNGSKYTIIASYDGYSTSTTFTAQGYKMEVDLSITKGQPASGGGTFTYPGQVTPTPTPAASPHLITPTPPQEPEPTAFEVEEEKAESGELRGENPLMLLIGLVGLVAMAGIGYYLLLRER